MTFFQRWLSTLSGIILVKTSLQEKVSSEQSFVAAPPALWYRGKMAKLCCLCIYKRRYNDLLLRLNMLAFLGRGEAKIAWYVVWVDDVWRLLLSQEIRFTCWSDWVFAVAFSLSSRWLVTNIGVSIILDPLNMDFLNLKWINAEDSVTDNVDQQNSVRLAIFKHIPAKAKTCTIQLLM